MEYSRRIVEAFALAFELHREQTRKGSGVPYVAHLAGVAALVGDCGGTEDQFIAALLHDAVEDQGGQPTLDRIRAQFGNTVADYVSALSDSDTTPKPPWRARKEAYLADLADASPDLRLIAAADKLHNARTIVADLRTDGNAVWGRFRGGRDGTLWYYAEVVRALGGGWSHPILEDLAATVDAMHRMADELKDKGSTP